ncbi:hypothetical protein V6x_52580 [Gimesia chilikensis]|uniref:Uncharacterized protein n=1 Tax=Gimesia chilikensis TaxID=2605989 RepID=A0A517WJU5_9PLAN|nr:hypothetical protein [Gimesia chilikensis]QDU05520.1 hypothetical protein V6x_52580 [Gimesia chilikensis]
MNRLSFWIVPLTFWQRGELIESLLDQRVVLRDIDQLIYDHVANGDDLAERQDNTDLPTS